MRDESTISSTSLGRAREDVATSPRPHLIVLMMGDDPRAPSSRHSLDGVDEVRFGRGPRHVARERFGRREVLSLHPPDARMSSEHGRGRSRARSRIGRASCDRADGGTLLLDGLHRTPALSAATHVSGLATAIR